MKHVILFILLVLCSHAVAEDEDFQPSDVLYAPESVTPEAAGARPQGGASYYSQARLLASDFGHSGRLLEGAELFIDGKFVGNSPVTLNGFFVDKRKVAFSARMPGYGESDRMDFLLPAEGDARIYLMSDNAASWFTTPSFVAGLLAAGASLFAYSQNRPGSSSVGLSLVVGGAAVIAVAQVVARFIYLPGLEKQMAQKNNDQKAMP